MLKIRYLGSVAYEQEIKKVITSIRNNFQSGISLLTSSCLTIRIGDGCGARTSTMKIACIVPPPQYDNEVAGVLANHMPKDKVSIIVMVA